MAMSTLEEIRRAADQLSPEEQEALIAYLQRRLSIKEEIPELGLLVFDVGDWPEILTLSRDEFYGDQP